MDWIYYTNVFLFFFWLVSVILVLKGQLLQKVCHHPAWALVIFRHSASAPQHRRLCDSPSSLELDWRLVTECAFLQVLYIWEHWAGRKDHLCPRAMTSTWQRLKKLIGEKYLVITILVKVFDFVGLSNALVDSVLSPLCWHYKNIFS